MFERYTESARRVVFFARYEACQFGATSIDTDHLLLGLTREAKGLTCEIFALSHVSLKSIRQEIEARAVVGETVPRSIEMPFSRETKRVFRFAAEEADRLRHPYIGTEHLLLGLLRAETSLATSTLMNQGLRLDQVRREIVNLLSEPSVPSGVLGLSADVDAADRVERIRRQVEQLGDTIAAAGDARELIERILRDLDALKRRLPE